jgi:uncharacterized membrane protein YesL
VTAALTVIRTSLGQWWAHWLSVALLNLAWALCWLTVVLGPPATFAVYRALHLVVSEQRVSPGELLGFLRRQFVKSWLWMLANAFVAAGVWANLLFYAQVEAAWAELLSLFPLAVGALWLAVQFYALPYLMEQDAPSLRRAWRNALLTLLASPLYTATLLLFGALLLAASLRFALLFLLGVPCLLALLGTCAVSERLEAFRVRTRDAQPEPNDT